MTVHIGKTKRLFKVNRNSKLMLLRRMHINLIMNRYGFDAEDYQRMRSLTLELQPFTATEETDTLIEIQSNKRFFWSGEDG